MRATMTPRPAQPRILHRLRAQDTTVTGGLPHQLCRAAQARELRLDRLLSENRRAIVLHTPFRMSLSERLLGGEHSPRRVACSAELHLEVF